MRMARPAHPGQFIKMEIIEPLNLTVTMAAKALGVTRPALSALLNGRSALSAGASVTMDTNVVSLAACGSGGSPPSDAGVDASDAGDASDAADAADSG